LDNINIKHVVDSHTLACINKMNIWLGTKLKLITMEQLDALAQILFGEFGFTTCTEEQMEYIITNYYILKWKN
jgi:hypothetical protein